jgi:predicted membrane protein
MKMGMDELPIHIFGILIFIIYCLVILLYISKKYRYFFINPIVQLILLLIGILLATHCRFFGMLYLVAYSLTYYLLYKKEISEAFSVVENTSFTQLQIEKDSLLDGLENNEDEVDGVWACSVLGKEMGLNKG